MATSMQWQLARASAERYEQILVPAILGPAARALVDWADLQPGESVIDVGCGTGAAARAAAKQVGPKGRVIGIDLNAGMIDVASGLPTGAPIEWRTADAASLPLADESVDVALCAQTLQFLPDKPRALAEMYRVLKPGGRVALSVWRPIADNPYFDTLVSAVERHIGADVAAGLKSAFAFSDMEMICNLLEDAPFAEVDMDMQQLDLPLPALTEFVPRHISATPMAAGFVRAPQATQQALIREVVAQLANGSNNERIQVAFRSHVLGGNK